MPHVVGTVDCLLQRAQHHGLQKLCIRPVLRTLEQLGVVARMRIVATAQLQPETRQKVAQRGQLLRRRAFMNAIEHRLTPTVQKFRSAYVCRQHAFLDQTVRVVAHDRHDARDLAAAIEDHLGLDGLEIDRPAPCARLRQPLVKTVKRRDMGHQIPVLGPCLIAFAVQYCRDFAVGEPGVRIYD